ncbi:hypothetical protein Tco_1497597, partial [Tanacetum coccineum]
LDFAADGDLWKLSGEEAWETIDRFAQVQKEWDNPFKVITEKELTSLRAQENELFGNEKMWIEMLKCIAWDKVDNPSPQSTRQVLPLLKEYTPPVTYPKEVGETIEILMEVEPLNQTQLEDLGLNTCSHDLSFSFVEVIDVDEPKP